MKETEKIYDIITDLMIHLSDAYEEDHQADKPLFSISENLQIQLATTQNKKMRYTNDRQRNHYKKNHAESN